MTEPTKKRGRPVSSKSATAGTKTKNITVTNPQIITMINAYCNELEQEMGFRPTITQALTRLLSNRKKK
jgi:hypothetical protein